MSEARPCLRRLGSEGKRVSQAGQGCPVSLETLWPSRERERFEETCGEMSARSGGQGEETDSVVICLMWICLSFER